MAADQASSAALLQPAVRQGRDAETCCGAGLRFSHSYPAAVPCPAVLPGAEAGPLPQSLSTRRRSCLQSLPGISLFCQRNNGGGGIEVAVLKYGRREKGKEGGRIEIKKEGGKKGRREGGRVEQRERGKKE